MTKSIRNAPKSIDAHFHVHTTTDPNTPFLNSYPVNFAQVHIKPDGDRKWIMHSYEICNLS